MLHYDGPADAANAARRFFLKNEDDLPEHVRSKIEPHTRQGSSPVDLGANFIEAAYANRDAVPAEMLAIAAGYADVFEQNGYHDRLDGRAAELTQVLRRDSGEEAPSGGWPAKDDDPPTLRLFRAPPPPPSTK